VVDPDFVEALRRRIAAAQEAAANACAESELLIEVTAAIKSGALSSRCAWCGSYRIGERWVPESEMPRSATSSRGLSNVSHSICPTCTEVLRDSGLSV
jgi:hypothetical protein